MGNRGIGSYDDVYRMNLAASTISVSQVKDDDLVRLEATSSRVGTFVEIEGKTEGWVAGNVHLDRNVGVRIGGSVRLN